MFYLPCPKRYSLRLVQTCRLGHITESIIRHIQMVYDLKAKMEAEKAVEKLNNVSLI